MATDPRDEYLQRVVGGRSFLEVGGLWGTVNEKVSVAHRAGAGELAMLDVTPQENELWRLFHERLRELGIQAPVACSTGDISQYAGRRHDVVHCSGVLYHHPNPLTLLTGLARACGEHLVLTSAITPQRIQNARGTWEIPTSGVLFVPALEEEERAILAEHWRLAGAEAHGITHDARFHVDEQNAADMGPWWWLPTAGAMQAMAEAAGFQALDGQLTWNRNACTLLLRRVR